MPLLKTSLVMSMTTNPVDRAAATARSGGWSEQFWRNGDALTGLQATTIAGFRALMLPDRASVIAVKQQVYTIVNNKLRPGGSSVIPVNAPGNPFYTLDVPQAALRLAVLTPSNPNKGNYTLRGMPDECVRYGEYQPRPEE